MSRPFRNVGNLTGAQLAAARKAAGLTQVVLAAKAGISRDAVSYSECLGRINPRGWAVRKMGEVEPRIAELLRQSAPIRAHAGMGLSPVSTMQESVAPQRGTGQTAVSRAMQDFRKRYGSIGLDPFLEARIASELARLDARAAEKAAKRRVRCEAKTTRKGTPCKNMSEPGKRRCKHHGGRSTGPRTTEGKARIAAAQRRRWAAFRENGR